MTNSIAEAVAESHVTRPALGRQSLAGTVDVVIPCYNYARYLRRCVENVLSQSEVNVRILVIDDASTDESAELGKDLEASDGRVNFHRHKTNKGHIATYNEGLIDWSTSEYVMLLSADDLLAPGSLSRAVRLMDEDPGIGMVYGRAIHFFKESELPKAEPQRYSVLRYSGTKWAADRCRTGLNVITSPEVVVRGSVQRKVGGYRTDLPHAGDLEMWLRIASVSNIGYVRGPAQAYYRVHSSSMQRTKFKSSLSDLVQRKAAYDSFFAHTEDTAIFDEQLHERAIRALVREALWDVCRAYDHNTVDHAVVDELVDFATKAYPEVASLSEYAALRRRQVLGPSFCNRTQLFVLPASYRYVARWLRKERWKRFGI